MTPCANCDAALRSASRTSSAARRCAIPARITSSRCGWPTRISTAKAGRSCPAVGGKPGFRPVWFGDEGPVSCPVYRREQVPAGAELAGPAIVEDVDSTTVIFAGDTLRPDESGVLILKLGVSRV